MKIRRVKGLVSLPPWLLLLAGMVGMICVNASQAASITTAAGALSGEAAEDGVRAGSLSVGVDHACGITAYGRVVCWGSNFRGQSDAPAGSFNQVSAGFDFTCGVRSNGALVCWGGRYYGGVARPPAGTFSQVAAGYTSSFVSCGLRSDGRLTCWAEHLPADVNPPGRFTQVAVSTDQTCAIKTDGTLSCWDYDLVEQEAPAGIFSQVALGSRIACGIRSDGTLSCWGDGYYAPVIPPVGRFSRISMFQDHYCGLRSDGGLTCGGYAQYGPPQTPPTGRFIDVAAGRTQGCGLQENGSAVCWGNTLYNTKLDPPAGAFRPRQVSAGYGGQTCEVRPDGRIACWGRDEHGQARPPAGRFVQVSAGERHGCGVRSNGTLACWGGSAYGESVPPRGTFLQLSAGARHTCAVKTDGALACWGYNGDGQARPPAGTFSQVAAGVFHSCGLKSDGTLVCWGDNGFGRASPPTGGFTQVAVGEHHACGLRTDGRLSCWGRSINGELTPPAGIFTQVAAKADGSCGVRRDGKLACWGGNRSDPRLQSPSGAFTQITLGSTHACGLTVSGLLRCWGSNDAGEAPPLTLEPAGLPAGAVDSAYRSSLALTAFLYTPQKPWFVQLSGNLPPGLTLDPAGVLSGQPTSGGTFAFRVRGLDLNGFHAERAYTVKIAGPVATPTPTPVPSPFPRPVRALNDTGITRCADATARDLPCPVPGLPGQDAEFGRDVTHPDDRDGHAGFSYSKIAADGSTLPLVASHWVCVKDNVTGLIWEEKTADGGLRDGHRTYSHYSVDFNPVGLYGTAGDASGFVAAVNAEGLCGARDWRLPSPEELQTLVDSGRAGVAAIDTAFFPHTVFDTDYPDYPGHGYWTSARAAERREYAVAVNFLSGVVNDATGDSARAVRLVRGAQPDLPAQRYLIAAGGQEVIDTATGLIWRRCSEGRVWDGAACSGYSLDAHWQEAVVWADIVAHSTGQRWRLPNRNELVSLLDYGKPAGERVDQTAFPGDADGYWSASPGGDEAWNVNFYDGYVGPYNFRYGVYAIWLVRDGP